MSPHAGQSIRQAGRLVQSLEPLPAEKNVAVALVLGIFFGALGVGIYFRSWKDFFVCLLLLIVLTIGIPAIGAIPGWLFAGVYGAFRAQSSNDRRRALS
jgi:hypothetical protein